MYMESYNDDDKYCLAFHFCSFSKEIIYFTFDDSFRKCDFNDIDVVLFHRDDVLMRGRNLILNALNNWSD